MKEFLIIKEKKKIKKEKTFHFQIDFSNFKVDYKSVGKI